MLSEDSIDDTNNDEDEKYFSDYEYEDTEDDDETENNLTFYPEVTVDECNALIKSNNNISDLKMRLQNKYKLICEEKTVNDYHASDLTGKKKVIVKENIFSANASFQVLLNDFVAINNKPVDLGYTVEIIDDNICTWRVIMTKFHPDTDIALDLAILDSRWDYAYVELQVSFAMDLYPFFPPVVTIVRPRIEGSMLAKIATLKMLLLDNWDPVRGVRAVLNHIRQELEKNGRVLVDSPYNSKINHPDGAYSDLESLLLKLSLVNATVPRIHLKQLLLEKTNISTTKSMNCCNGNIINNINSNLDMSSFNNSNSNGNFEFIGDNNIQNANNNNNNIDYNKKRNIVEFLECTQLEPGYKKPSSTSKSPSNKTWAKGTGYGSNSDGKNEWSMDQYLAIQAEKDNFHKNLLTDVLKALWKEIALVRETTTATTTINNKSITNNIISNVCQSNIDKNLSHFSFEQDTNIQSQPTFSSTLTTETSLPVSSPWDYIYIAIESSSLLPTLEQFLTNESLLDLERHEETYKLCFEILNVFSENKELHSLLFPLPAQSISIGELAEKMNDRMKVYSKQCNKQLQTTIGNISNISSNSINDLLNPKKENNSNNHVGKLTTATTATTTRTFDSMTFVDNVVKNKFMSFVQKVLQNICSLYESHCQEKAATESLHSEQSIALISPSPLLTRVDMLTILDPTTTTPTTTAETTTLQNLEEIYIMTMKPLQYNDIEFSNFHFQSHPEMSYIPTSSTQGRTRRLAQEHADLEQSLPLSLSSSVWIRASTNRIDALQALISGPDDTPYANGLFLFDVFFPSEYPAVPPLVHLQTTGKGTVRFNPNLYNDGKVCLSLLGTWSGRDGETWNAATSTFLQVLVSIQSLIFVGEPYFNEPGYECTMGTEVGIKESKKYNDIIREETLRWAIIHTIENPLDGFEEVINNHFKLKKDIILMQLTDWIAEAKLSGNRNIFRLEGLLTKFNAAMKKYE